MSSASETSTGATLSLSSSIVVISGSTFGPILGPSTTAVTDTGLATAALTTYTLITSTGEFINPTNGATTLSTFTSTVTDPGVYSSLVSFDHASQILTSTTSSKATSPPSSTAKVSHPSSNPSTVIPAVLVPIVFILALGLGWFILRRRHQQRSGVWRPQSRYEKPELDTTELPRTHGRAELSGSRGASLLSQSSQRSKKRPPGTMHELPGSEAPVAELESDAINRENLS